MSISSESTTHKTPAAAQTASAAEANNPWYKTGFMWLVVAIPIASLLSGGLMLYFALRDPDPRLTDVVKQGLVVKPAASGS